MNTAGEKKINVRKQQKMYLLKRLPWYILGCLLFYAPFALFNKGIAWVLGDKADPNIHSTCFRIPIVELFTRGKFDIMSAWGLSLTILFVSALLVGPFFCGRLCTAGALGEYMSRLVSDKAKIDWTRYVNPAPLRYGFFAGFVIAPVVTGALNCAYCSYGFFERMITGGIWGDIGALGSSTILTAGLWLGLFGVFTKGGRGYCNFMCPVGAAQSFLHSIGARLPFTYKLKYKKSACISCAGCVKACPMGALKLNDGKGNGISYSIHNCITCRQCTSACPTGAISYGTGERGWSLAPPTATPQSAPLKEGA
ncbi:4Fe-4S binding protein [Aneurinibacillus soli]|uniref:Quinol dehydrogenase membrane component n=1 Tax=Aneurinibacillus soli TaxID=1500254 RepID=A0A0U4WEZ0_9BACL|nr:4Fe-4S dicluster domain-containing protein [Aneurinibacillus soli]PYE63763.1 4Fe-4S binding protein [Aneurinibacillus soli]BAU27304.1 quinol dehydrogenase membrane component [Aneurinibacillus soli]